MASTSPKSESVLIENPNNGNTTNVPINDTGTAQNGMSVARQPCKKDEYNDDDQHERLEQRFNDVVQSFSNREGLIQRDGEIHVRRKTLLRFRH